MNNVLDTPKSVETIVMCLDLDMTKNPELSKAVLELMTVLCFYHREPGDNQGRDDVFDALCHFYTMKVLQCIVYRPSLPPHILQIDLYACVL